MIWTARNDKFYDLKRDSETIASAVYIERYGRLGWYWHMFINGQEGFCDHLEQAQAEAERAATPSSH